WSSGKAAKPAAGTVPPGLADRLVGPLVAEAKEALAEHIVADADLVDAGAIFGCGFAPFRGGPLHYAGAASGEPRPPTEMRRGSEQSRARSEADDTAQ